MSVCPSVPRASHAYTQRRAAKMRACAHARARARARMHGMRKNKMRVGAHAWQAGTAAVQSQHAAAVHGNGAQRSKAACTKQHTMQNAMRVHVHARVCYARTKKMQKCKKTHACMYQERWGNRGRLYIEKH